MVGSDVVQKWPVSIYQLYSEADIYNIMFRLPQLVSKLECQHLPFRYKLPFYTHKTYVLALLFTKVACVKGVKVKFEQSLQLAIMAALKSRLIESPV